MTFDDRSEEHTSELQSRLHLVCRLLLEKKKQVFDFILQVRNARFESFAERPFRAGEEGRSIFVFAVQNYFAAVGVTQGDAPPGQDGVAILRFGLSFFFNNAAATDIYTLSLRDALPI